MGDLGETAGTGEETRLFTGDGTGDVTGLTAPVSPHSARNSLRSIPVGQHGHCSIDGGRTDLPMILRCEKKKKYGHTIEQR